MENRVRDSKMSRQMIIRTRVGMWKMVTSGSSLLFIIFFFASFRQVLECSIKRYKVQKWTMTKMEEKKKRNKRANDDIMMQRNKINEKKCKDTDVSTELNGRFVCGLWKDDRRASAGRFEPKSSGRLKQVFYATSVANDVGLMRKLAEIKMWFTPLQHEPLLHNDFKLALRPAGSHFVQQSIDRYWPIQTCSIVKINCDQSLFAFTTLDK